MKAVKQARLIRETWTSLEQRKTRDTVDASVARVRLDLVDA